MSATRRSPGRSPACSTYRTTKLAVTRMVISTGTPSNRIGLNCQRRSADADDFHVHGREMYWLCTRKQTESKFSNAPFERALKLSATFRGLNTIARLAEKYATAS